jgi:hypothetical protein
MSDSEILFCYVLAGGFPREVMRCAQSIAMRNHDAEGRSHTLDVLASQVLNMEADRLIEASRSAVSGWEFHARDRMFRKFDDIVESWKATAGVLVTADITNPATRDTHVASFSSHESSQGKSESESETIVLRLELMVEFFKVIRQLFCFSKKEQALGTALGADPIAIPTSYTESAVASPSSAQLDEVAMSSAEPTADDMWRGDILQMCGALAEVRRLVETDLTAALQRLSKVQRQLEKEA